jgi:hypothetical protein
VDELTRKIRRVQPLIKSKQSNLDQEAVALENVRSQKREVMQHLKRYERLYIKEIEKLNKERQSSDRMSLDLLERNVDHYKARWYEQLRKLNELEGRERNQLSQVLIAKTELDSISGLADRYTKQLVSAESLREQTLIDEAAIRGFSRKSQ